MKTKKSLIIFTVVLIVSAFVWYKYFNTKTVTTYDYATATVKDIKKSVEGSGQISSLSELDIQQLSGGRVTEVDVKPGDFVRQGQIIARLDSRAASIQVAQAKASYDKIVNGSTKEDLDISNQNLLNSQNSYNLVVKQQDIAVANAKRNLLNSGLVARASYDDRMYSGTPAISGTYSCDENTEYKISIISSNYANVTGGKTVGANVNILSVPQAIDSCGLYISFDSSKQWTSGEWVISVPNILSTSYNANLNAYNTALQSRDQALLNASSSVANAQLSLNQKVVGARPEDIASAKASLASANLAYENTIIRAPFDGQIGSVSAIVGQQTSTQTGVATIITKTKIAEVSLNEIDIVNVKLGQDVELKLDAIPEVVFKGKVSQINTVGTTASNVVSFGVKIAIDNADERIKSGMSVTANIIVENKQGVLTVPSATIKTEGEKSYVLKKSGATNVKTYITTGSSNDIDTEVLTGLVAGDKVVSKTVEGAATAKKAAASFSLFGGGGARGGAIAR